MADEGGAIAAELERLDRALGRALPALLLGRLDPVVLVRWATVRFWVASAQDGDWVMGLDAMALATEYLASVSRDLGRESL